MPQIIVHWDQKDVDADDCMCSTFTPVPKRVMDGSEDHGVLPAAVLSGAPIELQARTVRYGIMKIILLCYPIQNKTPCLMKGIASTNPPSQLPSPETGVAITGEWTGTSSPRDTGGRIP